MSAVAESGDQAGGVSNWSVINNKQQDIKNTVTSLAVIYIDIEPLDARLLEDLIATKTK